MRPLKLSLEVLRFVFFFFFFVNPSQTGYQKLVGAVFVYPISIEATRREGSTYTIICSRNLLGDRSLAVLLPPVLSPFFFFFVLFPSCFLRLPSPPFFFHTRCLPPVLFVRILSLFALDWLFYRHSLFLRVPPIRLSLQLPFPFGTDCVV